MVYTVSRTVPKYAITTRKTVNVSKMSEDQRRAVFLDLNKKGYFVARDRTDAIRGCGVFNKGYYDSNFVLTEAHNCWLMGYNTVYCFKLDDALLRTIKKTCIKFIGSFSDYDVSVRGDTVHIGCQKIPKDRAVKMAKLILKGRTAGKPIQIGETDGSVSVHLSREGVSTYRGSDTPEKSVKLAKAVLKAFKVKA